MADGFDVYPPRTALPNLFLHESTVRENVKPAEIAEKWLASFKASLDNKDTTTLSSLFFQEAWWRDVISFTWDTRSKNGPDVISQYLLSSEAKFQDTAVISDTALAPQLVDMGPMVILQFCYTFTTQFGSGRGVIRLGNDGLDSWKAWTGYSRLEKLLDDHSKDPSVSQAVNGNSGDIEYYSVIIVGGGQSGLMIAAQLKNLGIKYLMLEKAANPGDAWRSRYDTIRSHTPSYADHFPFFKYPTTWPKYTSRDEIATWCDGYATIMGLNILTNAAVDAVDQNPQTSQYSVRVTVNGTQRNFVANQVVLAAGLFTPVAKIPDFPGTDTFKGQLYHSIEHKSAAQIPNVQDKKIVVIGAATTAHDVAQDFVQHGVKSVSMIQRGRIMVNSTDFIEQTMLGMWNTPGLTTEDADLLGTSMPAVVAMTLASASIPLTSPIDKELHDGLEKAGMSIGRGDDGLTFADHQFVKGGQLYIEQGASAMIIDGRIKVHHCAQGVKEIQPHAVVLADGTSVDADVVVLATGIMTIDAYVSRLMGPDIAKQAKDWIWMDDESERTGCWRPLSVPGLWYMTGPFAWARQNSIPLAVQIAAYERGLNKHQAIKA